MISSWKLLPLLKGSLTWLPGWNAWRLRHAPDDPWDPARYGYSVWLRHLVTLHLHGFKIRGAVIGELGPGDSLSVGLAALLCGAAGYVGLDVVPFAAKADLEKILDDLLQMYSKREPIPDQTEFPNARPLLDSYEYPHYLLDGSSIRSTAERIRLELAQGVNSGSLVHYYAPWTLPNPTAKGSLDLILSQAVLEHVDSPEEVYRAMFAWLKPGGYASHMIDFTAHRLSPLWNGHWAYSEWEWRLARGQRKFLLNREPLSAHVALATKAGFRISIVKQEYSDNGLGKEALSERFRSLDAADVRTASAMLILRKP